MLQKYPVRQCIRKRHHSIEDKGVGSGNDTGLMVILNFSVLLND